MSLTLPANKCKKGQDEKPLAPTNRVILELLSDHTELFKQFTDNPGFKRWLTDTVFDTTYLSGTVKSEGQPDASAALCRMELQIFRSQFMTKAEIAETIATGTGLTKKESVEAVEAVFTIMKSALESGENLKISGFGSFEVKEKADRRGRNPQTGEEITIAARRVLTFRASTMLKQGINNT